MDSNNIQASTVNINYNNYYDSSGTDAVDFSQMSSDEIVAALAEMSGADGMGAETTASAIANTAGEAMVEFVADRLEADDSIPQAKKDEINQIMEEVEQANGLDTPQEIADMMTALKDKYKDIMEEILAEETSETAEGAGGEAGGTEGKGEKGGHWMVALAKAMSEHAGNHLKKMIGLQGEIAKLERNAPKDPGPNATDEQRDAFSKAQGEHAARFTELTAQVQAHTQMFKMAQEMTSTVLKTLGEALNGIVRKQ